MAESLHDFSAAVEKLISINRDSEQGFRAAADSVPNAELKRMFVDLSVQRAAFASEIQEAVRKVGFEPSNPSGAGGTLHGVWISFKGAVLANKEHAVLTETERGEDLALKAYKEAMPMILESDLRTVVERQFATILQSHDRIRGLRDQTAPAPAATN